MPIDSNYDDSPLWRIAQYAGLVLTIVLLVGLFGWPDITLAILWNIVVPILPLSFLVTPVLWRGVCPLATLNMLSNGLVARHALTGKWVQRASAVGILLLVILVPGRRFLFNTEGTALAAVIIAVAVLALLLGALFDAKAGFCNGICPVLSVERLYGQRPFVALGNPRCSSCNKCTGAGCIDLAPPKSISQILGQARRDSSWLFTSFGGFAAAFPGFVFGYFRLADGPLGDAGTVYLTVLGWALVSYVVTAVVVLIGHPSAARAFPVLGAAAVGLYYWFVAPTVASTAGDTTWLAAVIRVVALVTVAFWLWRAWGNGRRVSGDVAAT
jgi:hypothetical protein